MFFTTGGKIMWWFVLVIWLCSGLTTFFTMTKYGVNRKNGYVSSVYLPLFAATLIGWPLFGLYAAMIREAS
jgi:hypothetical protein